MRKFTFTICRDRTESVEVSVEAESIEDAHEKGLAMANDDDGAVKGWQDDGVVENSCYLPDESDFVEEEADEPST